MSVAEPCEFPRSIKIWPRQNRKHQQRQKLLGQKVKTHYIDVIMTTVRRFRNCYLLPLRSCRIYTQKYLGIVYDILDGKPAIFYCSGQILYQKCAYPSSTNRVTATVDGSNDTHVCHNVPCDFHLTFMDEFSLIHICISFVSRLFT